MALLFDKQDFQRDCVENIINILNNGVTFSHNENTPHNFDNLEAAIKDHYAQKKYINFQSTDKKNIDILMETGTGKTYTYIKTIFEINKEFKLNKFIIVLPRTAIKQGVIQNIQLTGKHFCKECGYKKRLKFINYPNESLGKIYNNFIREDNLCVLITTNSAFNSEKNNINRPQEHLDSTSTAWTEIANQKPIVIIDEPHLLTGEKTSEGLGKLDKSLFLRFGATFPNSDKEEEKKYNLHNVAYSLDSIQSFQKHLVKKIKVHTVDEQSETSTLKLISTSGSGNNKNCVVSYMVNNSPQTKTLKISDDVGAKTQLDTWNGYIITKINKDKVFLAKENERKKLTITNKYELSGVEIKQMIRHTIKVHFEKEERLFRQGIKTLSLFFIPKVADFRENANNLNPRIKTIFEEEYKNQHEKILQTATGKYKEYLKKDYSTENEKETLRVHEGYFSGDSVKKPKDITEKSEADTADIDLILNQKEKLLSFDTNLRFVFSVWALQEGWDNPNVSTICKLSSTHQETSKRQQIGRGLRLVVNDKGKRITHSYVKEQDEEFYNYNTLDVIVSSQEAEFIEHLQKEIQDVSFCIIGNEISIKILQEKGLDDGEATVIFQQLLCNAIIKKNEDTQKYEIKSPIQEFLKNNRDEFTCIEEARFNEIVQIFTPNKNQVENANVTKQKIKIKQDLWKKFKNLWEIINQKAELTYNKIDEISIIEEVVRKFSNEEINPIQITVIKKELNPKNNKIENKEDISMGEVHFFSAGAYEEFIKTFIKDEKLPIQFVIKLWNRLVDAEQVQKIKNDPRRAKEILVKFIREAIHSKIIRCVQYTFNKTQTQIQGTSLHNKNNPSEYLTEIDSHMLGMYTAEQEQPTKLLYEKIVYDSNIEKEVQIEDSEYAEITNKQKKITVTVFGKLPKISIPTPYKTYNPDFGYVIEQGDDKKLYLIVETKGYDTSSDIPEKEKKKIEYAEKFFEALEKHNQNKDFIIKYKTRIEDQELSELLST